MNNSLTVKNTIQKNTLIELANRFESYLDVSEVTAKSYNSGVRKFLAFLHEKGINTPTRDTVILYKKELTVKYCAGTVSLYLSALRRFFAWCESEGLYANITSGVKSPKISHEHKRDAFSAEEVKGIMQGINRDSLEGMRNYAIFTLIASCGLRTIEVVRANVGDIHRVSGVLVLSVQGKGHTEKDAFVKLDTRVAKAISAYLEARGHVSEDEPLFASCSKRNKGQRLTTRTIQNVCKGAMIQAGFNSHRLTTHSLRHTAVTLALMAGNSLDDVSSFARHSNIGVTMIYNHAVSRLRSTCERSVASAIFG